MVRPLRRYAVFSGRASRSEYWWFYLLYLLLSIAATGVDMVSKTEFTGNGLTLAFSLPVLAVGARRLHDIDRSGWWMFSPILAVLPFGLALAVGGGGFKGNVPAMLLAGVAAIAIVGLLIALLVWYCTAGTEGPNRFGDDPLQRDEYGDVFD